MHAYIEGTLEPEMCWMSLRAGFGVRGRLDAQRRVKERSVLLIV
jgi:hypothetical protein